MRCSILISLIGLSFAACNQSPKKNKTIIDSTVTVVVQDSSAKAEPVPAAKLIIPGKCIGQTQINENVAKVFKRLGRPDAGDAAMGKSLSIWYANHDTTGFQTMVFSTRQMGTENEDSMVKQIRITSPWFSTADGIYVRSTLQQIKQFYTVKKSAVVTKKDGKYSIYKTNKGIAFETDAQENCTAIIVFDPSFQPGQTYLPIYDNIEPVK
ncbi:hypothetical protein ACFQ3S_14855 [Mucilaginibacter terrae]|uniref:hypothetical protein n=1 Tax=Mucilaginibacter terrae TaxID=1955052 RepID=UPI00363EEF38